jgi:Grx4 family monothiol glutaredoxin
MSTITEVTSEEAFLSYVSSLPTQALLILSFHAPWAAPCAQMSKILSTLASTYPVTTPPSVSFISINAEELPEISEEYDVTAVPFLVLTRGGKVLETVSGSDAGKVRDAIERHAKSEGKKDGVPDALAVTPREPSKTNGTANGSATTTTTTNGEAKSMAQYAPPAPSKEELFARLSQLVKAAPVMLFMKGTPSAPQCGFSRQLVGLLREKGVKYGFFNILADEDVRQGLKEFADWPTFPQLWVQGELVGGLDIVSSLSHSLGWEYGVSRG